MITCLSLWKDNKITLKKKTKKTGKPNIGLSFEAVYFITIIVVIIDVIYLLLLCFKYYAKSFTKTFPSSSHNNPNTDLSTVDP